MEKTARGLWEELRGYGADKAQCRVSNAQKQELNVENNRITLMRTTFDDAVTLTAIRNQKRGVLSVGSRETDALREACRTVMELSDACPEDDAYDIAAREEGADSFSDGPEQGDRALLLYRLEELLASLERDYPSVRIVDGTVEFTARETLLANSNGVLLHARDGRYSFGFSFAAQSEGRVASLNGAGCVSRDLSAPLLETGGFRALVEQNIRELDAAPLGDKFTGALVITPHCLPDFLGFYVGAFLSDGALISGTSLFRDKLGQRVAGENIHIYADPAAPGLCGNPITQDGFRARREDFIQNGVLSSFALSLYGARKTGGVRAGNTGETVMLPPGEIDYEALVGGVECGILLGRFSGGYPSDNGDFSGVAKNSFLIENGRVTRPIAETMVAGNLAEMFRQVRGASKETLSFGAGAYPWLCADGLVVSG